MIGIWTGSSRMHLGRLAVTERLQYLQKFTLRRLAVDIEIVGSSGVEGDEIGECTILDHGVPILLTLNSHRGYGVEGLPDSASEDSLRSLTEMLNRMTANREIKLNKESVIR